MIVNAILAVVLQAAEPAPSANLGYRLVPGIKTVYTLSLSSESTGFQTGRDETVLVIERAVLEPDAKGHPRVQVILRSAKASAQMSMDLPHARERTTVEYDSQKSVLKISGGDALRPFLASQYEFYSQLVNQPIVVTLGDDQRALTTAGIDQVVQRAMAPKGKKKTSSYDTAVLSGAMSGGAPGAVGAGIGSLLGSAFSALGGGSEKKARRFQELNLRRMMIGLLTSSVSGASWLGLPSLDPGRPVAPGDTWRVTWSENAAVSAAAEDTERAIQELMKNAAARTRMPESPPVSVEVHLKSIEGSAAALTYSADLGGEASNGRTTGNESAEVTFDTSLGLIRSLSSRMEVSIKTSRADMDFHRKGSAVLRLDQVSPPSADATTR